MQNWPGGEGYDPRWTSEELWLLRNRLAEYEKTRQEDLAWIEAEHRKSAAIRQKIAQERRQQADERRQARQERCQTKAKALEATVRLTGSARMGYVLQRRAEGATLKQIGIEIGRVRETVRQIESRAKRKMKRRQICSRVHLARPLDMGGPRDIWLTFMPSPDARFDNMEPVTPTLLCRPCHEAVHKSA